MKILLFTPPWLLNSYNRNLVDINQPLSLAYVGAACREAGHDVILLDSIIESANIKKRTLEVRHLLDDEDSKVWGLPPQMIAAIVQKQAPDVVGVAVNFSSQYTIAALTLSLIKECCPEIITVMGGAHVTVSPLGAINNPNIDYIVQGEGEKTFPALLDCIEGAESPEDIHGVGFSNGSRIKLLPFQRLTTKELDALPMPLFSALPMESYFVMHGKRSARMYTSRGCTFDCSFCSVPATSNRRFIGHSPQRVIAEVEKLISDWQIEEVMFEDDNMSLNPKRFRRIFELWVEGSYGLDLAARNFRCDLLTLDDLKLMKQAGFKKIWITPETGSQRVMDELIGKAMKLEDVWQSALHIKAAGLEIAAAFVLGMPGESWAEMHQTADFARKLKDLGATEFWFSIATPIEGTRLYATSKTMGLINGMDLEKFTYNRGSIDTDEWTAEELTIYRTELMNELNEKGIRAN